MKASLILVQGPAVIADFKFCYLRISCILETESTPHIVGDMTGAALTSLRISCVLETESTLHIAGGHDGSSFGKGQHERSHIT